MPINFASEGIDFEVRGEEDIAGWIGLVVSRFDRKIQELNIIFCSDPVLLKLNQEHLEKDYLTDVLTFDLSEGEELWGDIYISIDRVAENAKELQIAFIDELHRVIIHGVLHLMGFDDSSEEGVRQMRKEEDVSLALRMF